MESAEGILAVMKQAGLEPNDDSYVTLMCGYARKGDMENIRRIIKVCLFTSIIRLLNRKKSYLSKISVLSGLPRKRNISHR